MVITAEVFHIYFHKMDPTLTTSETINFAGWHKQQHKGIDAKKMLHSKPSSKLNVERSFIELFYSISFYVIWFKNKKQNKKHLPNNKWKRPLSGHQSIMSSQSCKIHRRQVNA